MLSIVSLHDVQKLLLGVSHLDWILVWYSLMYSLLNKKLKDGLGKDQSASNFKKDMVICQVASFTLASSVFMHIFLNLFSF